jgi:DnaK suppressor protein
LIWRKPTAMALDRGSGADAAWFDRAQGRPGRAANNAGIRSPETAIMTTPPDDDLLHTMRRLLEARQRQLEAEIVDKSRQLALDLESGAQLAAVGDDDRRSARAQVELDQAERDRDEIELAAVRAALGRVDAGRYGLCSDCGQPIDTARLQAQPEAPRCAICQRELERLRNG